MVAGLLYNYLKMKIGIIIQARMGSTRFPGKVLKKIEDKSLLELQYRRLKNSRKANRIIIATSISSLDDPIEELCKEINIPCYRGSEENVLERYYQASIHYNLDVVIRSNGDCPFIDSREIDKLIDIWESNHSKYDYVTNILEETFPLGMHIEIFSIAALKKALQGSTSKEEYEHVTPYIYKNPNKFRVLNIKNKDNLSSYRWTIDYPEDFKFVKEIYKRFGVHNSSFSMYDIIKLMKSEPNLALINDKFKKKQSLL